jgi:hypothetical protein
MDEAEMRVWAWEEAYRWGDKAKDDPRMGDHERIANCLVRYLQTGDVSVQENDHPPLR